MKRYLRFIIEAIIIFVVLIIYTVKEAIPEYRNSLGSSGKLLIFNNYVNYIEMNVDDNIDFAFLINEKGNVFHMLFFDKNASCLYNKNIENNNIDSALKIIFNNLKTNDILHEESIIKLYHSDDKYYDDVLMAIEKYGYIISENTISLSEKAQQYSINADSNNAILFALDLYSKELIKNSTDTTIYQQTNKWATYADEVYEKVSNYVKSKNIENMRKDAVNYPISLIPEDSMIYYPTTNSWYYVQDGSVYAYIEFNNNGVFYQYCYEGAIDKKTKGVCY